jgi:hypothetical protein
MIPKSVTASSIQPIPITALTTPKTRGVVFWNDHGPTSKGVPQNDLRNDPGPFWPNDPLNDPGAVLGNGGPALIIPKNDLGVVFENTRGRFGLVVSERSLGLLIFEIIIFFHTIFVMTP